MSNPLYYPNRDMLASGFPTNWTLLKRLMWVRIMRGGSIAPTYETVTGNPVSFETVRPYKLRQLSVAFSPVQSGTGDPSPDNVRPISGWDGVEIYLQSAYDPTAQPSISISFGSTVYSGTLDVVNGKMTVDRAMVACTWGDFLYKSTLGSYVRGSYDLPNKAVYPATAKTPQISNVAPFLANFTTDTLHFYCNNNQAICFLPVDTADSTEIQISYELATPVTIQLTPQEVSSLLGENNMWSDANGDLTVEYRSN